LLRQQHREAHDRTAALSGPHHRRASAGSVTAFSNPQKTLVASFLTLCNDRRSSREGRHMSDQARGRRVHERWAHLRFSVIGQLLAAPPRKRELAAPIRELAARPGRHPTSGEPTRFGFSTIERWYCRALKEKSDPVAVLRRKLRADAGQQPAMRAGVRRAILAQYAAHKSWSVQLHYDNLRALIESNPELKPLPSYATLRRFLKANGLAKQRRIPSRRTAGAERAEARFLDREVRSYEVSHVGGLVHFDAHYGSKKVLTPRGELVRPILFAVLDDRSRVACHLQ